MRKVPATALLAGAWGLGLGGVLASGGCGVDDRDVEVARLQPDAAVIEACGPQCPEVLCPADDACKDYTDRLPQGSCSADGACASVADCSFTWRAEARDGAACSCDATGCKLGVAEPCTRPELCESGNCVATDEGSNLCCAAACAPDEVCTPDGNACVAATPCSDDQRRCSGAVYQHCAEGVWQDLTDCAELGCSIEREGCLRAAGQACETDADCGEGSCLATAEGNRVCCTGACDTTCRRCAASGTACEDVPDDEACGSIECPTDPCRNYTPTSVTTNRCAQGQCATAEEACTVFEPVRADLECSPTALCDGEGNCSRPKKDVLAACSVGSECGSGACVASGGGGSVCCAEQCAPNEICSATGTCVLAPVCESDSTQCSGSTFQRCSEGQWRTVRECGALGCSVALGDCLGAAGDTCSSDADCGAGSCQPTSNGASVCCTAACDGACRRCAPSGTTCENLSDDAACGIVQCPADSTCRNFPSSVSTDRCVAGRCGSAAQLCVGAPRNAGQVCSATNLCDASGNCAAPKKGLGTACVNSNECALGNCVDGVCCNSACNGVCTTCASTGICRAPATDSSCATGLCASPGVCQQPAVTCGSENCLLSSDVCCSEFTASGNTRLFCEEGASACPPPPAFIPDIPIRCDEPGDCPSSRVCCFAGTSTSGEVACKLPNPSPGTNESSLDFESCAPLNPMLFGNRLCRSPEGSFPCPAFENCEFENDRLPGFVFCR